MSVDNFIGAVKVKRDEALASFLDSDAAKAVIAVDASTEAELRETVSKSLDQLAGGILDVLNEQYEDIIEVVEVSSDDEMITMAQITEDLSTIYFEEVSS